MSDNVINYDAKNNENEETSKINPHIKSIPIILERVVVFPKFAKPFRTTLYIL